MVDAASPSICSERRLLVVDDDVDMRELVARMLAKDRHRVTLAADGETALRLFRTAPFDLVVSDLFMPDSDGLELLRGIRAHKPETPVVVLSGADSSYFGPLLRAARMLGAVAALEKPVAPAALRDAVRTALRTGGVTEQALPAVA